MICLPLSSRRPSLSLSADSIMTCVSSPDRGAWGRIQTMDKISEKDVVRPEMMTVHKQTDNVKVGCECLNYSLVMNFTLLNDSVWTPPAPLRISTLS